MNKVTCGKCQLIRSDTGVSWPQVILEDGALARRLVEDEGPVSPEEFAAIHELAAAELSGICIRPGVGLGPFQGVLHTDAVEVVYRFRWELFFRPEVLLKWQDDGVVIPRVVGARIVDSNQESFDYVECVYPAFDAIHSDSYAESPVRCSLCGIVLTEFCSPVIDTSAVPDGVEMFRCWDWSAGVIVSERVAELFSEISIPGLSIVQVDVR